MFGSIYTLVRGHFGFPAGIGGAPWCARWIARRGLAYKFHDI